MKYKTIAAGLLGISALAAGAPVSQAQTSPAPGIQQAGADSVSAVQPAVSGGAPAAQTAASTAISDKVLMVLAVIGPNGQDTVGLTYPTTVSRAQVQKDVQALSSSLRTQFKNVSVENDPDSSHGSGKVTSVTSTAPYFHGRDTHSFAIGPVITALRGYPHIVVTYLADNSFQFHGLRDFADNNVNISFDQGGAAYTYKVRIKNAGFQQLNLPSYTPSPAEVRQAKLVEDEKSAAARRRLPWMVALVTLVAVVAGGIVYAVTARQA